MKQDDEIIAEARWAAQQRLRRVAGALEEALGRIAEAINPEARDMGPGEHREIVEKFAKALEEEEEEEEEEEAEKVKP